MLAVAAASLAPQALAADIEVGDASGLIAAINNAAAGDTITFKKDITLTSNLPEIQTSVTIDGRGFTLSGANRFRALTVLSGAVIIDNLTIANARALGGNGGNTGSTLSLKDGGGGGGAAGLGGALFVAAGARVLATNLVLRNNLAQGGNGGASGSSQLFNFGAGGGGGGVDGDGGNSFFLGFGGLGGLGFGGTHPVGGGGFGGGGDGGDYKSGGSPQPGGFGGGGGGAGGLRGVAGAVGGFGGGGGGSGTGNASGGFGGGSSNFSLGGGGGAGLGGAIFVQQGGSLDIQGSLGISGNNAKGGLGGFGGRVGAGGAPGNDYGSGLFLQGSGNFTLAPGAGQTQTISDVIADQTGVAGSGGSWSLVKIGFGTTILTGRNAYSGGTTISQGVLQGNVGSLVGKIVDNNLLVFDQPSDGTSEAMISGPGSLTKTGAGSLVLNGPITYSGLTQVFGGQLLFSHDFSLAAPGPAILLNNGVFGAVRLRDTAPTVTVSRNVTLDQNSGLSSENGASLVMTGIVRGGLLTKTGSGSVTLSGANTFSGLRIQGGSLLFTKDNNLGAANQPIEISGGGSVGTTDGTLAESTFSRNIELLGNGGVSVAVPPITWSGAISGSGQFVKSGIGILELTGKDTYEGGTLVNGGTLKVASDNKLGKEGTGVTLNGGGLWASDTFATSRPFTLIGSDTFQVEQKLEQKNVLTLNGTVNGTGDAFLTKVGVGTLALTNTDNVVGRGTLINGGTLAVDGKLTSNVTVNAGGTLAGNGTVVGKVTADGGIIKPGISIQPGALSAASLVSDGVDAPDALHIEGAYTQIGGTITFDIDPDGKGGFLESALLFDPGDPVSITGAKIVFDFLNGANPLAFFKSGAFDLDSFFQESDGSLFSNDFNLESLFAGDAFTTDVPAFDITGFGANGAVDLVQASVPEPSTWVMLIAGFAGLGFAGWRRGGVRIAAV